MSDLTAMERRRLERALDMSGGYVLDFTNRTFEDFFLDYVGIEILDERYHYASGSKANRMRAFWDKENNYVVAKLLSAIFENWTEFEGNEGDAPEECMQIVRRLKERSSIPDLDVVSQAAHGKDFEALARSVREAIQRGEPEAGLDRLHTFLVKYFRRVCEKHGVVTKRESPLHSLVGAYRKILHQNDLIETTMTASILANTIEVIEAYNKIRNEHSYAHDNPVLNRNESCLVLGHVVGIVRFVDATETELDTRLQHRDDEQDDIPL